jgi:hypothetical protein
LARTSRDRDRVGERDLERAARYRTIRTLLLPTWRRGECDRMEWAEREREEMVGERLGERVGARVGKRTGGRLVVYRGGVRGGEGELVGERTRRARHSCPLTRCGARAARTRIRVWYVCGCRTFERWSSSII